MIIPASKDAYTRQHYFLINYRYKKALDRTTTTSGYITVQEGTGNINQKWYIEPQSDSAYRTGG